MENITERLNEAIEEIRTQICEVYGSPPDEENAEEVNEELSIYVKTVAEQAMESVKEAIRRALEQSPVGLMSPVEEDVGARLARMEAKLDQLISQPQNNGVRPVPITKLGNKNIRGNLWARYQKAWNKWRREEALEIPTHAGERSKLCSADYKNFKLKSIQEQDTFLSNYCA